MRTVSSLYNLKQILPERENSQGPVRFVTRWMCQTGAPEVIVEQVGKRSVPSEIAVVHNCL